MARCACGTGTCSCIVKAVPDSGISVVGNGSPNRPYQVGTVGGNPLLNIDVRDHFTLDLAISGAGTPADKRIITGKATQSLTNLKDIGAGQSVVNGDAPVWRTDHWEFEQIGTGALPPDGTDGQVLTKQYTVARTNLHKNPNVEAGIGGWASNNTGVYPLTLDTAAPIGGSASAMSTLVGPSLTTAGSMYTNGDSTGSGTNRLPVTPGVPVTWGIDVRPELANRRAQATIFWRDAANAAVAPETRGASILTPAGQVTRLVVTGTPPPGAAFAYYSIGVYPVSGNATVGERVWYDNATAETATTSGTYFDGDTADTATETYNWTGAVNASTSQFWSLGAGWEDGSRPSGVWGTAPLDAKYGADSLLGRETYVDSAGKLRAKPDVIPTSAGFFTPTTPIDQYPPGSSVMSVSGAEGVNWPAGASCTVVTHKRVDTTTAGQWCFHNRNDMSRAWYRNANLALWGPWVQVAGLYSDSKGATALTTLSTTAVTDIAGMTLSVPVPGPSAIFSVTFTFDVACVAITSQTFVGSLVAGGATYNPTVIVNPGGSAVTFRGTFSQTVLVTGLAAGTHVFKGVGQCSTANQFKINATHSTINVTQIA